MRSAGSTLRVDRVSAVDLTVLLTDRGPVPMNIGALLDLGVGGPSATVLRTVLAERVPSVRRLRQRLRRVPFGCGRPVWVDDPGFALDRHLSTRTLHDPHDDHELLDITADVVCLRLDPDRPLWRACLVVDPRGRSRALVVVLHHVLADGLGGLAILAALADPGTPVPPETICRAAPTWQELVADAAREKVRALAHLPAALRSGLAGLRELGISPRQHPRLAARTSLNRPTSGRRRLATTTVPLAEVVTTAHHAGGTVNDVVLAAITGALITELAGRGEHPPSIVVSVPVSGRRSTTGDRLGNDTGVQPVAVPALTDDRDRLAAIVSLTRARRDRARASSAVPLGLAFRTISRLGLFRPFVEHQRLVHTFETNLRGPAEPIRLGGHPLTAVVPAAVSPGNVGVTFDVLSYAGTLGVTMVADPDVVSDLEALAHALAGAFARLTDPSPTYPSTARPPARGTTVPGHRR